MKCLRILPVLIAAVLLGSGCSSRQYLMPTPTVIAEGAHDPFALTTAAEQRSTTPVFVVSGREPSGRMSPARFYSNDRSRVLRLGRAELEIGAGMTWPELVDASRDPRRSTGTPIEFASFEEYGVLWASVPPPDLGFTRDWTAPDSSREPASAFAEAINDQLLSTGSDDAYIFVHGFNTDYTKNLGIAAEIWHYSGRRGAMLSFAWPSEHSVFAYQADKANAAYATRQLREFLRFLVEHTDVGRINIVAHSAGNPIVVEAMRDLRLMHYQADQASLQSTTRIGRVVLAAPDMDLLRAINATLDGFDECAESVVMYASTRDTALSLSSMIFSDTRLGASVKRLSPEEQQALRSVQSFEAVDVSRAQKKHSTFLGHSYYHQNPWVSSDIGLYLTLGLTASERGLERDEKTGFWVFPPDYESRLQEHELGARSAQRENQHEQAH